METVAVDRGGSFGRNGYETRNWMRASAPGIAFRCRPAESSPVGRDARAARSHIAPERRAAPRTIILLLECALLAVLGGALYAHARAQPSEVSVRSAWSGAGTIGAVTRPAPAAAAAQAQGT